jgi:hypothetical protein
MPAAGSLASEAGSDDHKKSTRAGGIAAWRRKRVSERMLMVLSIVI